MTFISQAAPTGAHLFSEGNGDISRDSVVILSGQGVLPAGAVLGRITAAGANLGKYAKYDNAATDGRNVAAGVLWKQVDATSADAKGTAHVRLCELVGSRLSWGGGVVDADKVAAYADLAPAYVLIR